MKITVLYAKGFLSYSLKKKKKTSLPKAVLE